MPLSVIILCGGKGTRIRPIIGDIPKILAPINQNSFLEYFILWLKSSIGDIAVTIYLSTCVGHHIIADYISRSGFDCILSCDDKPLGTLGAVINVVRKNNITGDILVLNGDTIFQIDLDEAYKKYQLLGLKPLLVVKRNSNLSNNGGYNLINKTLRFCSGNPEYISLGAFFCPASVIYQSHSFHAPKADSLMMLDYDFLDKVAPQPYILSSNAYFIDIGTPPDYERAQTLIPSLLTLQ